MNKILVTGGAGFIGSAVVRLAVKLGFKVVNVDSLTYASNLDNLATVVKSPNYSHEEIDLLDRDALYSIFGKYEPCAVIHLAAETHVDQSIDHPKKFIETNIIGTFNLLEASRIYWLKKNRIKNFRFLHVSTDEVFGTLGPNSVDKFTEDTAYDPRSPYSASKAASDHLVRAWHETYGLPVLITHSSNNFGPYQFPEKLIPVIISNALLGNPIPIYGNGQNIRDWIYVDDNAQALIQVLKLGSIGRTYNIGGGNELSNLDIATKVCDILDMLAPKDHGSYSDLVQFVADRPGHDFRYAIDTTRVQNELGWIPMITLECGLKETIKWYLANEAYWSPNFKSSGSAQKQGQT